MIPWMNKCFLPCVDCCPGGRTGGRTSWLSEPWGDSVAHLCPPPRPRATYLQTGSPREPELHKGPLHLTSHGILSPSCQLMVTAGEPSPRDGGMLPSPGWTQAQGRGTPLTLLQGPATVDISTSGLFMNSSICQDKLFCIRLPWLP